ncbi:glycoside hydrolase family 9 protein [Maribacter sp. 2-571]|uniref:glycoside hydrolase family 9 protein n=1 Tax=Maribacter sp. 2-571 TaxID=3417569 RepID=UPI003D351442
MEKNDIFRKGLLLLLFIVGAMVSGFSQGIDTDKNYIRVDQFGYMEKAEKKAIIAKSLEGFNNDQGILLDADIAVELRTLEGEVVLQKKANIWRNSEEQDEERSLLDVASGDRGWTFDFTEFQTPGEYYIQVTDENGSKIDSHTFKIGDAVYEDVLRVALETFYYQRIGQDKTAEYGSGANWVDTAWYQGKFQDTAALSPCNYDEKYPGGSARDVGKGWIDAGDPNKYINLASPPVHNLLTTYQQHPEFWNDFALRIPEAGGNLPDILDEIKWELDWVMAMQDPDGAVISKVGVVKDAYISPPSTDDRPRFYSQTCPSASMAAAGMLAHAALVYKDFDTEYSDLLLEKAVLAWEYYLGYAEPLDLITPGVITDAEVANITCQYTAIKAGDGNGPLRIFLNEHYAEAAAAAVYLFAMTGDTKYDSFFISHYEKAKLFRPRGTWGLLGPTQGEAFLYYTGLDGANLGAVNKIKSAKEAKIDEKEEFYDPKDAVSLYGIRNPDLNWGSNSALSRQGSDNLDYLNYAIDLPNHQQKYQRMADAILHYFHGVNPLGITYLTNMYEYGGDFSVDQLWHTWFKDGTDFDGRSFVAGSAKVGPVPGFISGGVNKEANAGYIDIYLGGNRYTDIVENQPLLKKFSDENGWNPNKEYLRGREAYRFVENANNYQASYIKFLANYVANTTLVAPDPNTDTDPDPDPDPDSDPDPDPTGDLNTLIVRAKGTSGGEAFRIQINNQYFGNTNTVGTEYQDYSFENVPSGTGNIKVRYINDNGDPAKDLQVDYIQVGAQTIQAEDQRLNTGVSQNGTCGGSNSEMLNCNGFILFGNVVFGGAELKSNLSGSNGFSGAFKVVPNPSSNKTVTITSEASYNVTLYDLVGHTVFVEKGVQGTKQIRFQGVQSGVYLLELTNLLIGTSETSKIVID